MLTEHISYCLLIDCGLSLDNLTRHRAAVAGQPSRLSLSHSTILAFALFLAAEYIELL